MNATGATPTADRPAAHSAPGTGERTLLAWVRTSLAMMGFGFVVARFGLFLRQIAAVRHVATSHTTGVSLALGMAMVSLGVAVNLAAAYQHIGFLRRLETGAPYQSPRWSLAVIASVVLALLGAGIAGYLLLRS